MDAEIKPPSGTVTFLFTDVEGSTGLWDAEPDQMASALEIHDRVARSAIGGRGGYVFSTAGDSFAAAFARADSALAAAQELVAGLADVVWPTSVPLRVRVGAHTGEAQERDGDYFGPAVNRAARVMGAGHGGQILMSETTAGVVGDVGRRLGEFVLRGFAEPVGIFQVGGAEFPPLRTSDVSVGNLPRPAGELVGRVGEVAEVAGLARRGGLVTVVGAGGMGKTRLAIEAATELALDMPHGGWFVDLATAAESEAVVHLVIDALGVRVTDGDELLAAVARHLAGRRAVVLLDNCEHVIDGVAEVAEAVLAGVTGTTLLATSRERLGVRGEQMWPLGGLPADEGVDLFVERARSVDPHLEIDKRVVAELCVRLDGMPLAIELAAARVGSMTPAELLSHLDERFRLLGGSRRQAREQRGSRALRETVEWSFGLLDDDQQAVLVRLSAFVSPFGVDGAVALCANDGLGRFDVIDVIGELVDKSLLVAERSGETTRFRMLETIRAFGHERLDQLGARDDVRRAHATYVAAWLAGVLELLEGAEDIAAATELDNGWAELREAVRWSLQAGAVELAVELTAGLGVEAQMRELREAREWLWSVAEMEGVTDHPRAAELFAAASIMDWVTGRYDDGLRRWQQVETYRGQEEKPINVQIALAASQHYTTAGRLDRSMGTLSELRLEAAEAGDWFIEAYTLATLSIGSSYAGDTTAAQRYLAELKPMAGRAGNGHINAFASFVESMALVDTDPAAAVESARSAMELADAAAVPWIANMASNYLTYGLIRSGDYRAATQRVQEVLEELAQGAAVSALSNTARNGTVLLAHFGRSEAAATLAGWLTARNATIGPPGMREYAQDVINDLDKTNEPWAPEARRIGELMTAEELIDYAAAQLDVLAEESEAKPEPPSSQRQ